MNHNSLIIGNNKYLLFEDYDPSNKTSDPIPIPCLKKDHFISSSWENLESSPHKSWIDSSPLGKTITQLHKEACGEKHTPNKTIHLWSICTS